MLVVLLFCQLSDGLKLFKGYWFLQGWIAKKLHCQHCVFWNTFELYPIVVHCRQFCNILPLFTSSKPSASFWMFPLNELCLFGVVIPKLPYLFSNLEKCLSATTEDSLYCGWRFLFLMILVHTMTSPSCILHVNFTSNYWFVANVWFIP